jgi:hypothetical protein
MLIRICSHFHKQNNHGIDELIRIDGLPDDLIFRREEGKVFLRVPFEKDIDANIPKEIREHCTPIDITENLPREKNEATGQWQTPSDTIRILGVKLDLDSTPGMETWKKLQRILERDTPRDQKVPSPAVVAPDMTSPFFLEAKDIPVVVLRQEVVQPQIVTHTVVTVPVEVPKMEIKTEEPHKFECGVCHKNFGQQRGLWMHERKTRHKVKEPVAA